MGAATDLESEGTRRLLVNAIYWAVGLEDKIPARTDVTLVGEYHPLPFGFNGAKKGVKPEHHLVPSAAPQAADSSSATSDLVLPKAFLNGTGPGWKTLRSGRLRAGQLRPRDLDVEGRRDPLHGTPGRRAPHQQAGDQLRAGRRVETPRIGREFGDLRVGSGEALEGIKPNSLPRGGIEVQILDHGYKDRYEKRSGKKATWFTTNGDVFAVGTSKMAPFPPLSPDGSRSFPRKNLSKGVGEWNHYYVRGINGEVRLWVNGEEVSGGSGCEPAHGVSLPRVRRVRRSSSGTSRIRELP